MQWKRRARAEQRRLWNSGSGTTICQPPTRSAEPMNTDRWRKETGRTITSLPLTDWTRRRWRSMPARAWRWTEQPITERPIPTVFASMRQENSELWKAFPQPGIRLCGSCCSPCWNTEATRRSILDTVPTVLQRIPIWPSERPTCRRKGFCTGQRRTALPR